MPAVYLKIFLCKLKSGGGEVGARLGEYLSEEIFSLLTATGLVLLELTEVTHRTWFREDRAESNPKFKEKRFLKLNCQRSLIGSVRLGLGSHIYSTINYKYYH